MKNLITILFLIFSTFSVYAQSHVFILVDVSKSVKQSELNDARQALNEILIGQLPSKAFIPTGMGNISDLPKFKLEQGDKLVITKFGNLHTTLAISPNPSVIQNVNADVSQVLNSITWTPKDQQTYFTLAKAKIAEYAKNNNITSYKLYILSDNEQDEGNLNYQDDYARNLVQSYNTSTNPVSESGYTRLIFSANSKFMLQLSPKVDVSKYTLPGGTPIPIVDADTGNALITLTLPRSKAKKGKEHEIKTESLNINWTCKNCPQGIKYTVMVSQYDGGKFKETKKDLTANTATFKVPDGKFRITVSASNYPSSSDNTHIIVSTGSYGWLLFLVILLAAGAIGYYFWNKKRQEKIDEFTTNKAEDIFSNGNGNTTSNSSNSDYF